MDIDIKENRFDSLPNIDIYPETTKLSLANVLLEWNQNNNVRCNILTLDYLFTSSQIINNCVNRMYAALVLCISELVWMKFDDLVFGISLLTQTSFSSQYLFVYLQMVNFVDQIFPVLLKTLSDSSDEVLILNLQVLAEICCPPTKHPTGSDNNLSDITNKMSTTSDKTKKEAKKNELLKENPNTSLQLPSSFGNTNPHFSSFILSLLKLFRADRNLLDTKGSFIIR